ncbi:MAG: flagellar hook-basal body complex protein FliE [Polyangiales bacterium]
MSVTIGSPEQLGVPIKPPGTTRVSGPSPADHGEEKLLGPSFAEQLQDFVGAVDKTQKSAEHKAEEFAVGHQNDIHGTMIAVEQAEISLHLLANVRNRVVDLYREVMRMGS